jgi:hypothetical protein
VEGAIKHIMSEDQIITETSKIFPVNILVFGIDNDKDVGKLVEDQMAVNQMFFEMVYLEMFYEKKSFQDNLYRKPQICFVDYDLDDHEMNGNQLTKIITDLNEDCKVIMLSGMPVQQSGKIMQEFFNDCGGWKWLEKRYGDGQNYMDDLFFVLQQAIKIERKRLTFLAEMLRLKEETRRRKIRKAERSE